MSDYDIIKYLKKVAGKFEKTQGVRVWGLDVTGTPHVLLVDDQGRLLITGEVNLVPIYDEIVLLDTVVGTSPVESAPQNVTNFKFIGFSLKNTQDVSVYVNFYISPNGEDFIPKRKDVEVPSNSLKYAFMTERARFVKVEAYTKQPVTKGKFTCLLQMWSF